VPVGSGPEVVDMIVPFYAGLHARQEFPRERKQLRERCCFRCFCSRARAL